MHLNLVQSILKQLVITLKISICKVDIARWVGVCRFIIHMLYAEQQQAVFSMRVISKKGVAVLYPDSRSNFVPNPESALW